MVTDKLFLDFFIFSSLFYLEKNQRYLNLSAKLLDAKEQAASFKLEKNKHGQKEAQEKIRKIQRGEHLRIFTCRNVIVCLQFAYCLDLRLFNFAHNKPNDKYCWVCDGPCSLLHPRKCYNIKEQHLVKNEQLCYNQTLFVDSNLYTSYDF